MTRIEYIAKTLTERKQTVTCAESCTGGLLSAALTSVAGSSAYFERSFVTYSDQSKRQLLNVNDSTLRHYGAVSEETVREMALGALIASKCDYALSFRALRALMAARQTSQSARCGLDLQPNAAFGQSNTNFRATASKCASKPCNTLWRFWNIT